MLINSFPAFAIESIVNRLLATESFAIESFAIESFAIESFAIESDDRVACIDCVVIDRSRQNGVTYNSLKSIATNPRFQKAYIDARSHRQIARFARPTCRTTTRQCLPRHCCVSLLRLTRLH